MADVSGWREEGGEWFERRTEVVGAVACSRCGREVELVAETDEWEEGDDGRWHHAGASLATGVCCDLLYADWWEGCFVYDFPAPAGAEVGG